MHTYSKAAFERMANTFAYNFDDVGSGQHRGKHLKDEMKNKQNGKAFLDNRRHF